MSDSQAGVPGPGDKTIASWTFFTFGLKSLHVVRGVVVDHIHLHLERRGGVSSADLRSPRVVQLQVREHLVHVEGVAVLVVDEEDTEDAHALILHSSFLCSSPVLPPPPPLSFSLSFGFLREKSFSRRETEDRYI